MGLHRATNLTVSDRTGLEQAFPIKTHELSYAHRRGESASGRRSEKFQPSGRCNAQNAGHIDTQRNG